MAFPRGKFVKVNAIRISKSGKVDIKVPAAAAKRLSNPPRKKRRNVAAGFYDEDGYFHPIRASYDYSPSRGGDKARKAPAKKKKAKAKTKRKR